MFTPKRQHPFIPLSNTVAHKSTSGYGRWTAASSSSSGTLMSPGGGGRDRRPVLRYLYPSRLLLLARLRLRPMLRSPWVRLLLVMVLALLVELQVHNRSTLEPERPAVPLDAPFHTGCVAPRPEQARENGVIVMLVANHEVERAVRTLHNFERRFNRWYAYPYVFFNDEPWSREFVERVGAALPGRNVTFEVLDEDYWGWPKGWDEDRRNDARARWSPVDVKAEEAKKAKEAKKQQKRAVLGGLDEDDDDAEEQLGAARTPQKGFKEQPKTKTKGVMYSGKESYHHMCHFFAGKFYDHPALTSYKWYWRLDSDIEYLCDMPYDPFVAMSTYKKRYGYAIALWEVGNTVPSLFRAFDRYRIKQLLPQNGMWLAMMEGSWLPWPFRRYLRSLQGKDEHGDAWNFCHFWSNFEIADMDWFRGQKYRDLFKYLEDLGGIYTERWGDAPIHSLAAALLLHPSEIHYFGDYGYAHDDLQRCPANKLGAQLEDDDLLELPSSSDSSSPLKAKRRGRDSTKRGKAGNRNTAPPPLPLSWDAEKKDGVGCRCSCSTEASWLQPTCQNLINRAIGGRVEKFGN